MKHRITAVATQGRATCSCDQWVTSYKVAKLENNETLYYKTNGKTDKVRIQIICTIIQ